jgi:hypothetical protein
LGFGFEKSRDDAMPSTFTSDAFPSAGARGGRRPWLRFSEIANDLADAGAGFAIVGELGPFVSVLVASGAGATAVCADLGARKIREELDAMEVRVLVTVRRAGGDQRREGPGAGHQSNWPTAEL